MLNRLRSIMVLVAVLLCSGLFPAADGTAVAGVNIRLPLPRLFLPAPPPLVVIPGTYVYVAPDVDADIVFYQGAWYRPHGGSWYMSDGYNGPWRNLSPDRVPRDLIGLPPNFRRVPPGHERMPYGHVQKNWKTWEHERHWDDNGKKKKKHDKESDHGRGRGKGHDKRDQKDRD